MGSFLLLAGIVHLLRGAWDDDDDWDKNFALMTMMRLQSQVGSLVPSPTAIDDNWKILKSPAAAVNWTENVAQ